jgi:tRNA pseudouridine32 synthase/23S rRNA pseudouridine746 synthase
MAFLGHPILGDNLYAHGEALAARERLCLHAQALDFRHPAGGAWMSFHSPAPF